jgi:hypothetical protein
MQCLACGEVWPERMVERQAIPFQPRPDDDAGRTSLKH